MTRIAIIPGSTRPGRKADAVAEWVLARAGDHDAIEPSILDPADYDLAHLDEPKGAMSGEYTQPHTRSWSEAVAAHDGYVIATPEYNHSVPGALKTALDFLYAEWNDKAVGFVGYGAEGGVRAIEHLRGIAAELQMADVRKHVALSLFDAFTDGQVRTSERHEQALDELLHQVTRWTDALAPLRAGGTATGEQEGS